jgi:hypothetical protein
LTKALRTLRECLVADAVAIEPVSTLDFPANREKYREVSIIQPLRPRIELRKARKIRLIL